ncbi:acylneuraminate cytidylyltransferase family protein [Salinimicrobium oceani]|uniref:Acylneuraminate cytidylyltransferase family protein n=1 Tax=Salinimicrobium oceani TaxID=2722702 RepID=A0ABX1D2J8_9FLAO|nr:acylneuraminate cytidylyltransferase family protein [Salinimicrobium oceani]NJW53424.1 acylneuraminate cytidylyltransferase family protein [Salinimicrobium oceani]
MSVSVFLPVRKGSERVVEKNTRVFSGIQGGLLQLKLEQLQKIKEVDEVVISTNDAKCYDIATFWQKSFNKIKIVERPAGLGDSNTILSNLIVHAGEVCSSQHILWTHVTSPFFGPELYSEAIKKYIVALENDSDSLVTGRKYRDYLLDVKSVKLINNHSVFTWPRTQDLNDCFEINNAVFLAAREFFRKGVRIGKKPFLMVTGKINSLDIDDEEDFKIAEAVYERFIK